MKILVVFFAGLGNALLLTPALRELRTRLKRSTVHVLLRQDPAREVLLRTGLADCCFHHRGRSRTARIVHLSGVLVRLRAEEYDAVIVTSFHASWLTVLARLTGASKRIGFSDGVWHRCFLTHVVPQDFETHEASSYRRLMRPLTGASSSNSAGWDPTCERWMPRFDVTERERAYARMLLPAKEHRPWVGVHPGCSPELAYKRWPVSRFVEVCRQLVERAGVRVALFGGPEEVELTEELASQVHPVGVVNLAGRTSVGEAAACAARCSAFVSNDSGLMHLAAAVRTPTVAVFGPTFESKNRPLGSGHRIVREPVPGCFDRGSDTWLCRRCRNRGAAMADLPRCLDAITPERVLNAVESVLEKHASDG